MKREAVTNSGPLMVFSKLNALHLMKELYGEVLVPQAVYRETVMIGLRSGHSDAKTLHSFLEQNVWRPRQLDELPEKYAKLPLDRGEKEAIYLAASRKALLLMDEGAWKKSRKKREFNSSRFPGSID